MKQYQEKTKGTSACKVIYTIAAAVIIAVVCPFNVFCESPQKPIKPVKRTPPVELPDSIRLNSPVSLPAEVVADSLEVSGNQVSVTPVDSFPIFNAENISYPDSVRFTGIKLREFNPDPVRAVWYSALFP